MSLAVAYLLPGNHFVALGGWGGGGRKLGALVQTSIKRPPPSFSPNYDAKKGAYNRASTVYSPDVEPWQQ